MNTQKYPCLRIAGPKCVLVREDELDQGTWFLDWPDGDFEDIGDSVRVTIASVEMKAMDWIVRPPVVTFDKDSPVYKAIQFRSNRKDEKSQWGPEYTLRINGRQRAMLYLGNKSSRNLMSSLRIGGKYVLLTKKRTHGEYTWYVPAIQGA